MSIEDLRLNQPERRFALVREYYERHHQRSRDITISKDDVKKAAFYNDFLKSFVARRAAAGNPGVLGIDLGCRGGALTRQLYQGVQWQGVDIDHNAIELARKNGIPCEEMDITTAIDFKNQSFDVAVLTEVLEHLPYPPISVGEVRRILKPGGAFMGSVPIDYHLHRRWSVMRGGRLTYDPTHLHSFSFGELDELLRGNFAQVSYCAMRGTAARHPGWGLSFHHFVRDIAWIASDPRMS